MAADTNGNPLLHDQFDCSHTFSFGNANDDGAVDGYIDVKLARPVYTTGSMVAMSLHSSHDVSLTGVGVFRLDPRWNSQKKKSLSSIDSIQGADLPADAVAPGSRIFWKTETVLCEAVPRPLGPPYQPPPIVLPNFPPPPTPVRSAAPERLAVVRIQLPEEGPPTLIAISCRYHYALLVQVVGASDVFQVPIPVVRTSVATDPIDPVFPSTPITIYITNTTQLLTPSEREQVQGGEWSVVARPPTIQGGPPPSLLLTDQGVTLCRLVFVSGFTLTPGSIFRCHIVRMDPSCRQISGHLTGRECCGSSATTTRVYSWDTTSQSLEHTETCCLSLCLPNDHAVPRNTLEIRGVVTIRAMVELDVTVSVTTSATRRQQFRTVHAEIPCHIVAAAEDYQQEEHEDDPTSKERPYAVRDLKVLGLVAIQARELWNAEQERQGATAAAETR